MDVQNVNLNLNYKMVYVLILIVKLLIKLHILVKYVLSIIRSILVDYVNMLILIVWRPAYWEIVSNVSKDIILKIMDFVDIEILIAFLLIIVQVYAHFVNLSFILISKDKYAYLCLLIVSGLMLQEDVSSVKVNLH